MPDIGPDDLDRANDAYNERLDAAGVPDGDEFGKVDGPLVHGDLFDSDDALSMAEALAVGYQREGEVEHFPDKSLGMVAQVAVHGVAVGVLAERRRWRPLDRRYDTALRCLRIIATGRAADAQALAATTLEGLDGSGNGAGE